MALAEEQTSLQTLLDSEVDPALNSNDPDPEEEQPDEALQDDRELPGQLDAYLAAIIKNAVTNAYDMSSGYKWIRKSDVWSMLCKGWTADVVSKIYQPNVLLWIPDRYSGTKLKCPEGHHLVSKGAYDKPKGRRVLDVDGWFYLVQWRYECRACAKREMDEATAAAGAKAPSSWGSGSRFILEQLPAPLRNEFKIFLTHRSAVTDSLALLTRQLFSSGMGPKNVHDFLQERFYRSYAQLEFLLLSAASERRRFGSLPGRDPFLQISAFDDRQGYNGYIPSAGYLKFIFCELERDIEQHVVKMMSLTGMEIGKCDHSFKVIARLHCYGGQPYASALYTSVNELEGIRGMRLCVSKSLIHVKDMLEGIDRSNARYGLPQTRIIYTDSARIEEPFMSQIFRTLKPTERSAAAISTNDEDNDLDGQCPSKVVETLPFFSVPKSVSILTVSTVAEINDAFQRIVEVARDMHEAGFPLVVGLDCEWPISFVRGAGQTGKTSVIQVAFEIGEEKKIIVAQVHLFFLTKIHI